MWSEYVVCEADDYFVDKETGEYKFNARDLPKAHNWCRFRVETFMKDNVANEQFYPNIVVSNTFTQEWEMEEYFKLAKEYASDYKKLDINRTYLRNNSRKSTIFNSKLFSINFANVLRKIWLDYVNNKKNI
jgi:hypothetical protein